MILSSDSRFLATLSCSGPDREETGSQVLSVWEWSLADTTPLHSITLANISAGGQLMQVGCLIISN